MFVTQLQLATTVGVLSDAEAAVFVAVQGMRQLTKVDDTNLQFGNIYTAAMALRERQTWVFTLNLRVREGVRCGLVVKQSALCLPPTASTTTYCSLVFTEKPFSCGNFYLSPSS